jgi:hypothetical protein
MIILAIVVVLIAIGAFFYLRWRRSENLRRQFGPEYKRAVKQYGDEREAGEGDVSVLISDVGRLGHLSFPGRGPRKNQTT